MTSTQRVVLLLFIASLFAGLVSGSTFYYRIAYLWIFLYVGSWAMSRLALRGVEFQRTARSLRSQVGQIFEERYEVSNTSRLPRLWMEVRDESGLPGARGSQVLSLIGGNESRSYLVRTRLLERGVFPLGPTTIVSGDLFGLFQVSETYLAKDSLLVYPMMVDVEAFPSPIGWLSGGEALRRRTHQITPNAAGVRDYATGDPLNRIHWVSTARRNRLIVKEFELDPMAEVWIFVDASRFVQAYLPYTPYLQDDRDMWRPSLKIPLPPSTEEYAVSIAASLARFYIQRGRAVGLVSAGSTFQVLAAERGGRQMGKILESLALLRAQGKLPIQGLIEAEVKNLPRGSTVIVITPSTEDGALVSIELLGRRLMRPIAVLLNSISFGGSGGTDKLAQSLELLSVPVIQVGNGDDLSAVLSSTAASGLWV
ncbi:MAG: DUF58 domain-containing protein [Anaerolineales bacterium]|nr:MAG: DUF58 domain-containing protein [Anaerolineales bacterium]